MKRTRPEPIGNIGILSARIPVINEVTNKWDTLVTCLDTPNSIAAAIKDLPGFLWVVNGLGERKPLGQVNHPDK